MARNKKVTLGENKSNNIRNVRAVKIVPLIFAIIFLLFTLQRAMFYYSGQVVNEIWQPVLVCEQSVHDFGKVEVAANPSHSFTIKNSGNIDLLIESVSAGCGACVKVVEYTESSILLRKTGTIKLELLTQNLSGKVSKEVLVKTNDPKNPNLILTLEAEVIRPEEKDIKESNTIEEVSVKP